MLPVAEAKLVEAVEVAGLLEGGSGWRWLGSERLPSLGSGRARRERWASRRAGRTAESRPCQPNLKKNNNKTALTSERHYGMR